MLAGPNTKIRLEELTDEHLKRIITVYRSLGFPCNDNVLDGVDADCVREEVGEYGFLELRPAPSTSSHLTFNRRCGDGDTPYVHVEAEKDSRYRIMYKMDDEHFETLLEDFDNAMREEFCKDG